MNHIHSSSTIWDFCKIFFRTLLLCFGGIIIIALFSKTSWGALEMASMLPNTTDDANLEYIELRNNSCVPESYSGYSLSDVSGKSFLIPYFSLDTLVTKRFFQSETKIILNNSDETVFLKDSLGTVIEEFSYKTSTKWETISIHPTPSCQAASDMAILPTEVAGSGATIHESWSGSSGIIEPSSPPVIVWTLPEISVSSGTLSDMGAMESSGSTTLSWSVFSGSETSGSWTVSDTVSETNSWSDATSSGSSILVSGSSWTASTAGVSSPSGTSSLSSPLTASIRVQSGLDSNMSCFRDDCSVNFELLNASSKHRCVWDFAGASKYAATDILSCNPSYIHYPKGEFRVSLRVCLATNASECTSSEISFRNYGTPASDQDSPSSSSTSADSPVAEAAPSQVTTPEKAVTTSSLIAPSSSGAAASKSALSEGGLKPSLFLVMSDNGVVTPSGKIGIFCPIPTKTKKSCTTTLRSVITPGDAFKDFQTFWYFSGGIRIGNSLKNFQVPNRPLPFTVRKVNIKTGKFFESSFVLTKASKDLVSLSATSDTAIFSDAVVSEVVSGASATEDSENTTTPVKTGKTPKPPKTPKAQAKTSPKVLTGSVKNTKSTTSTASTKTPFSTNSTTETPWLPISAVISVLVAFGGGVFFTRRILEKEWFSKITSRENEELPI